MLEKEKELVCSEYLLSNTNYNLIKGGILNTSGLVSATHNGSNFLISVEDFNDSKNIYGITKGYTNVKTDNGYKQISNEEFKSGDYVGTTKDMVLCKDGENNTHLVSIEDPRYLDKTLLPINTGYAVVKDLNGEIIRISKSDPDYINGNYVGTFKGKKHKEESLNKMRNHTRQIGEKNSQFNTCWVSNDLENLKVKSDDKSKYLEVGYREGINISLTKRKTLDNDIIEKIHQLSIDGFSANKISKMLNISKTTVLKYLKS